MLPLYFELHKKEKIMKKYVVKMSDGAGTIEVSAFSERDAMRTAERMSKTSAWGFSAQYATVKE
jgi:hypothetical protein